MEKLKIKLAGETGASTPTVRKWLEDPSSVFAAYDYALKAAAKKLDLEDEIDAVRSQLKAAVAPGLHRRKRQEG